MKSKILLILAVVISAAALGYLGWRQNTETWTYSTEYLAIKPNKDLVPVKVRFNKKGEKETYVNGRWLKDVKF